MNGNCAANDCTTAADFPDENGKLWCDSHYDGPADFCHVENDNRRKELEELYDK